MFGWGPRPPAPGLSSKLVSASQPTNAQRIGGGLFAMSKPRMSHVACAHVVTHNSTCHRPNLWKISNKQTTLYMAIEEIDAVGASKKEGTAAGREGEAAGR